MEMGTMRPHVVKGIAKITISTMLSLSICTQAWAWGATGHRLLAEVAAELNGSKSIWGANSSNLGVLTNVPDRYWKGKGGGPEENPTHYFEPDAYFNDPANFYLFPPKWADAVDEYGVDTLVEHGTAVWRIQQFRSRAIIYALSGDYKSAVEQAGAMSHYVGDLSQPLHVTTNYDGQETYQKGIHKFFETTNLEGRDYQKLKDEVIVLATLLLNNPNYISQNRTVEGLIFNEVNRAYAEKDKVLQIDSDYGRTGKGADRMYKLAKNRLADGAATLAILLSDIWIQSGQPTYEQAIKIDVPSWVMPDYEDLTAYRRWKKSKNISFFKESKGKAKSSRSLGDCEL